MKKKIGIILIIFFAFLIFIKAELDYNPSVRILASIVNFSESTLKSSDYIAYGIDLKDLFRNYTNSDVRYSGSTSIKKIEGFPYSLRGSIRGERSSSQKKFSCMVDLDVLALEAGELDVFADNDTIYLVAPMLGGISYGFDTNNDLFAEAPNLTKNINSKLFHENKRNIFNLVRNIKIESTGEIYEDEDGTKATEFAITIPKGEGGFIWDLLGTKAPNHDINCSIFLDKHNRARKLVFDLSYKTDGAYVALYGKNLNTIEIYRPLPDDEYTVTTVKRNGETLYTNSFTSNISYYTANGDILTIDNGILLNYTDYGIKLELTNIVLAKNDEPLLEGYVNGKITPVNVMNDVFEDAHVDLSNVKVIDWNTIKNDTASFIDDVINQARDNVDLFNFPD